VNPQNPTTEEILAPGFPGDREVDFRLTLRQVATLEYVLTLATKCDVGLLALAAVNSAAGEDAARCFRLEFSRAQARLGIGMMRALGNTDGVLSFTRELARLDGEETAL
jgi:hypothetical protein